MALPTDYSDRVYAGVLGKVIGVYLGRPFEGWTYEMIQERLGDIEYYVHDKLDVPLLVTDDDISGTFTFLRALADNHANPEISAKDIGNSWLNYIIENKSILWWGGMGNSTEHTAFLRLKSGIEAPRSGSESLNGKVVAEQIGAQIFIDGWAMVAPGDPDQAAKFAEAAARVSHDGEAVYGAIVMAVMESMAFIESNIQTLIDKALTYIPVDSVISRLIEDVRAWHASESDWRATRELLAADYGYDKFGGNCHMVPNHGLIIHSLLHGNDDFSETLKIINTSGWDTDCNSGNVGCLMGIKNGLTGIDVGVNKGLAWRSPVADRIYIPTAEGGRGISDCAHEAVEIINLGRALSGEKSWYPKQGAQFHFEFPGAVQGFTITEGDAEISNVPGHSKSGQRSLKLILNTQVYCGTPVFVPSKDAAKYFEKRGYALMASPRVYAGQIIEASLKADENSPDCIQACVYIRYYGENDQVITLQGDSASIEPGIDATLRYEIPAAANPVFEIGVFVSSSGQCIAYLDYVNWSGEPRIQLTKPDHKGTMWRRAWVTATDNFDSWREPYRLVQNTGTGLLIQGSRQWRNYNIQSDITPHLAARAGIAARVQGLKRYYAFLLVAGNKLQLVRMLNSETLLAECDYNWRFGETYQMSMSVQDDLITAQVNGTQIFSYRDENHDLSDGSIALVIEEGRTATQVVEIQPLI